MKKKAYLLVLIQAIAYFASGQILTTIAGNNTVGYSGDGGIAALAVLNAPQGTVSDHSGNLFFADANNNCVRKISITGIITTVAGNGTAGYSGDGGPATDAQLFIPLSVAIDTSGNIFIVENKNHCIRKVDAMGMISTIAGNGTSGFSGDGGPASDALLHRPTGIAADKLGNIYFNDAGNARMRKIDDVGIITTIAGTGIIGYSGDGGQATAATLRGPYGICFDGTGNIYFADGGNNVVRKIETTGLISTIAGNGVYSFGGDDSAATSARFANPQHIAIDNSGNLYIADYGNNRIRKVDGAGVITTVAGDGIPGYNGDGPATSKELFRPNGIAVGAMGEIFIADQGNNRIRHVMSPLIVTPLGNTEAYVSVYPSPVKNVLTVSCSSIVTSVAIYNAAGQIVYAQKYNAPTIKIDVSQLPCGLYLLQVNGASIQKFQR